MASAQTEAVVIPPLFKGVMGQAFSEVNDLARRRFKKELARKRMVDDPTFLCDDAKAIPERIRTATIVQELNAVACTKVQAELELLRNEDLVAKTVDAATALFDHSTAMFAVLAPKEVRYAAGSAVEGRIFTVYDGPGSFAKWTSNLRLFLSTIPSLLVGAMANTMSMLVAEAAKAAAARAAKLKRDTAPAMDVDPTPEEKMARIVRQEVAKQVKAIKPSYAKTAKQPPPPTSKPAQRAPPPPRRTRNSGGQRTQSTSPPTKTQAYAHPNAPSRAPKRKPQGQTGDDGWTVIGKRRGAVRTTPQSRIPGPAQGNGQASRSLGHSGTTGPARRS